MFIAIELKWLQGPERVKSENFDIFGQLGRYLLLGLALDNDGDVILDVAAAAAAVDISRGRKWLSYCGLVYTTGYNFKLTKCHLKILGYVMPPKNIRIRYAYASSSTSCQVICTMGKQTLISIQCPLRLLT